MDTTIEELCRGNPRECAGFLRYARSLGFDENRVYASPRASFRSLSARRGFTYDLTMSNFIRLSGKHC